MNKPFLGILILVLSLTGFVSKAQTINHSTIDKVGIIYKLVSPATSTSAATTNTTATSTTTTAATTTTTSTSSSSLTTQNINVRSLVNIALKPSNNASKIYLKMLTQDGNTLLYQANYVLSSTPIINSDGIKLFEKVGNKIDIINPTIVLLEHYKYQLFTEDSNGILSEMFTITK